MPVTGDEDEAEPTSLAAVLALITLLLLVGGSFSQLKRRKGSTSGRK
jgi:hypothetical protein